METELGSATLKMAGSLMLILCLMFCLFYVFKRLRLRSFHLGHHSQMRLISTLNVAPRRAVALVELCDRWFVLGIGTESVRLIAQVERPPESQPTEAPLRRNGQSFQSFLEGSGLRQQWRNWTVKRKHETS